MARIHSKTLMFAGALTIAATLLGALLLTVILPLLPPLHPLTSQLLVRFREVVAFLAFTTALTIGILTTQRKDAHHENQYKHFMEYHSLGSIFGESAGYEEMDPSHGDNGKHSSSPSMKRNELSKDKVCGDDGSDLRVPRSSSVRDDGFSPQNMRSSTREGNRSAGDPNVQRRLHRKSSSLDDSVNYVAESEAPIAEHVHATNNEYGVFASNKSTKRVSFSMTSSPSSPMHVTTDQNRRQLRRDPAEMERDLSATSPGDLTGQADAFIAKFKEQLRMQNLESIPRYRRRP